MSAASAPKVFISYRREDTAGHAGRLYDEATEQLGRPNVFMDVDLAPGLDFVERITSAVGGCRALLVVIGPRWATGTDVDGAVRLADPHDFVRLEVETALRREDVTVIPVLVAGARMPAPDQLPESLRPLARRNAIELSDQRWRYDVGRLLEAVGGLLGHRAAAPDARDAPTRPVAAPAALAPQRILEGTAVGAAAAGLAMLAFRGVNAKDGTLPEKVASTTLRNALVWGLAALLLSAWLAWRRGARGGGVAGAALLGLLLGGLAGALGSRVFAGLKFQDVPVADDTLKLVSIGVIALAGAGVGMALGAAWRPRRLGAALLAGAAAGALAQTLLVAAGAPALPNDALRDAAWLAAAVQGAAIAAAALATLLLARRPPAR